MNNLPAMSSPPQEPVLHKSLYDPGTFRSPRYSRGSSSRGGRHDSSTDPYEFSDLKQVKSHAQLAKTAHGVRLLAKNLNKATIQLHLRSVMIVTKARDNSLIYITRDLAEYLLMLRRAIDVYVDYHLQKSQRFDAEGLTKEISGSKDHLKYWSKKLIRENPNLFDLVITLGGDGTVLYASTLFQRVVPPILSFALGSLGFLTNFAFSDFQKTLKKVIENGCKTNLRMRFTCRVHKDNGDLVCEQQVLNELTVDRGPSPWVSMLELYGDGSLLTVAQADGLLLATPTGSTAYSLSAGGSLVHPSVSAIIVTPICPHTLSFRPILLPDSMTVKVKVPARSRATAWASFDGRSRVELQKGYYVTVTASPFPFPTIQSSKNEYFESVSSVLNWNKREEQKSFYHLLSDKTKKSYKEYHRPKFELESSPEDRSCEKNTESANSCFDDRPSDECPDEEHPEDCFDNNPEDRQEDYDIDIESQDGDQSDSTIELDERDDDYTCNYFVPRSDEEIHTPEDRSTFDEVYHVVGPNSNDPKGRRTVRKGSMADIAMHLADKLDDIDVSEKNE